MNHNIEPPKIVTHEKRGEPRHPFHWPVTIVFAHNPAASPCQGATHDISMEGCAVLTEHNFAPGTHVAIQLSLPPNAAGAARTTVEIGGHIVYTVFSAGHGQFRSGISFLNFREDGKNILLRAIKQRTG